MDLKALSPLRLPVPPSRLRKRICSLKDCPGLAAHSATRNGCEPDVWLNCPVLCRGCNLARGFHIRSLEYEL